MQLSREQSASLHLCTRDSLLAESYTCVKFKLISPAPATIERELRGSRDLNVSAPRISAPDRHEKHDAGILEPLDNEKIHGNALITG